MSEVYYTKFDPITKQNVRFLAQGESGSSWKTTLTSLSDLYEIISGDCKHGDFRHIHEENCHYKYDSENMEIFDGLKVVAPADRPPKGRWLRVESGNALETVFHNYPLTPYSFKQTLAPMISCIIKGLGQWRPMKYVAEDTSILVTDNSHGLVTNQSIMLDLKGNIVNDKVVVTDKNHFRIDRIAKKDIGDGSYLLIPEINFVNESCIRIRSVSPINSIILGYEYGAKRTPELNLQYNLPPYNNYPISFITLGFSLGNSSPSFKLIESDRDYTLMTKIDIDPKGWTKVIIGW